jgi:signal peptidase II
MRLRRGWVIFVELAAATVALDQGSKAWAHTLPLGVPRPVVGGYWDWELAMNPGAAFSSFIGGDGARIALSLLAAAAVIALGIAAWRAAPAQRLERAAYALIAGGALGNLLDRVRFGAVTDFIRWRIGEHRWPIFNVADAALLAGAVLLLAAGWRARRVRVIRTPS